MAQSRCGKHTELSTNAQCRVTRCPCGTIHVHMRSGVTVQLPTEVFKTTAAALMTAVDRLVEAEEAEPIVN